MRIRQDITLLPTVPLRKIDLTKPILDLNGADHKTGLVQNNAPMNISDLIQKLTAILETDGDLRILLDDSTGNTCLASKVKVVEGPYGLSTDNTKVYSYDKTMVIIE